MDVVHSAASTSTRVPAPGGVEHQTAPSGDVHLDAPPTTLDSIALTSSEHSLISQPQSAMILPLKETSSENPLLGVSPMVYKLAQVKEKQRAKMIALGTGKNSHQDYSDSVLRTSYLEEATTKKNTFILKDPLHPKDTPDKPTGMFNFITMPARSKIIHEPDAKRQKKYLVFEPENYRILVSPHEGDGHKAHAVLSDTSLGVLHAGTVDLNEGQVMHWDNSSSTYAVADEFRNQSGFPVERYENFRAAALRRGKNEGFRNPLA